MGVPHGIVMYRCGCRDDVGASSINRQEILNAQQSLGAAAIRSVSDETVRLPLSSLTASAQINVLGKLVDPG